MKRVLSVFFALLLSIGVFASCSSDKKEPSDNSVTISPEDEKISSRAADNESSSDAVEQAQPSEVGKVEIVEKEDGTKFAKSETGIEVEYSSENLENLLDEYENLDGTDEDTEKELLSQIQTFLEAELPE